MCDSQPSFLKVHEIDRIQKKAGKDTKSNICSILYTFFLIDQSSSPLLHTSNGVLYRLSVPSTHTSPLPVLLYIHVGPSSHVLLLTTNCSTLLVLPVLTAGNHFVSFGKYCSICFVVKKYSFLSPSLYMYN